jgi:hypothetical protein
MEYYKNLDLKDIIYINDEGLICWEEWKDIPEYEGIYQVSDLGKVKSLSRFVLKNGKYPFKSKDLILKLNLDKYGYLMVNLFLKNKSRTKKVHQLVAIVFLNHTPCGLELVVNHKNFIRVHNHVWNLEIVTPRENSNHTHLPSSSEFTGVCLDKSSGRWRAGIYVNGKIKLLGTFVSELEASTYYENALQAITEKIEIKVKKRVTSSKHKGVSWDKRNKKWVAQPIIKGKRKCIGAFKTEEDAYQAILNY